MGLFQHCGHRPIVFLPPTSSRIHIQRRHASSDAWDLYQRRWELLPIRNSRKFTRFFYMPQSWDMGHISLLANSNLRKSVRIFYMLGHGTFFYFPSEGRHTEDFPDARKIQRLRPGLNPRTRFPLASMLTTRPPKPSMKWDNNEF